ncbi:MAG: GyrI-like domain-containing protein [Candidatus Korobacteraceae bacterium]|jgi:predicted transcriptional regulator YdeE
MAVTEVCPMLRFAALLLIAVALAANPMLIPAQNLPPAPEVPQLADLPAFTVIGLAVRTTNAREMMGSDGRIAPLWDRFIHGGADAIPGSAEQQTIYAVYTHYESDETGAYDFILGKSVPSAQPVPEGMEKLQIPAARYLVFSAAGSSPDAIKAAWLKVYDYFGTHSGQQRAFTTDFERHSSSGSKLYIAVREVIF